MVWWYAQRKKLHETHGKKVLDAMPGSEMATKELMEMSLQFLVARYPQYFSLETHADTRPDVFVNRILNREFVIREMDPLHVILENIPEDFALVFRNNETGEYELRAGVICSSLGWNLGTKMGMTLQQIHGPIPDYKEKMSMSMDRHVTLPAPPTLR